MAIDCNPCNCIEAYYRDLHSWRKAMLTLLCNLKTTIVNLGVNSVGLLTATGVDRTDAAQIVTKITKVSGADDTKGVKLPSPAPIGETYIVYNYSDVNSLYVYPGGVADTFDYIVPVTEYYMNPSVAFSFTALTSSSWIISSITM